MNEILSTVLNFLSVNMLIGFGIFTLSYFVIQRFKKSEKLKHFDEDACKLIVFFGVAFILVWIFEIGLSYFQGDEYSQYAIVNRMSGQYWYFYWLGVGWILLVQLLRFKVLRESLFFRLLISIPLSFTFERLVIIITSLHSDHLPSSWWYYGNLSLIPMFLTALLNGLIFTSFVGIYHFTRRRLAILKA
jgi:hypothetical protein